ncbi:phage/plasmid primase, P4 family [Cupriavidus sp. 2TAF22]|uniref:DNA primase family protein n=1 Tax=unclassified Cupriavidus TaxID=2640874 RepID=UPI003F92816A
MSDIQFAEPLAPTAVAQIPALKGLYETHMSESGGDVAADEGAKVEGAARTGVDDTPTHIVVNDDDDGGDARGNQCGDVGTSLASISSAELGTILRLDKLCHYERHVAAAGLPKELTNRTCAEIQRSGFEGCPARRRCVGPNGREAQEPSDMQWWARVEKFSEDVSQQAAAQALLDAQYPNGLVSIGKVLYAYKDGYFPVIDEAELTQQALRTFAVAGIKVADAQQVLKYMKYATRQPVGFFAPNRKLLCFHNGTLNVETGELGPHSPGPRLISRINANYVATAECPRFLQFLNEVFRDDADREQRIGFVRQWMGYLLIPDTSLQKMLFLLGKGRNGKSVLCKVIAAMLGKENVSHAMLNRLGRAAVRVELAGKLANFSPDLPAQALKADGYLKAIVSGDPVEAERKYSDSCTITPYCRLVVATNSMPDTPDRSDGFFRRLIILPFNRQFTFAEDDPGLLDRLLAELDGIIAWAVEGLQALLGAGRLTIPPSSLAAREDYRCDVNPVQQFAEECLVGSPNGGGLSSQDLFELFRRWSSAHGHTPGTSIGLGRALANLGFQSRKSSHTIWLVSLGAGATAYQSS